MKKIISTISATIMLFAFSLPIMSIAKSAEFFTIGTGGPTEFISKLVMPFVKCYTNQQ